MATRRCWRRCPGSRTHSNRSPGASSSWSPKPIRHSATPTSYIIASRWPTPKVGMSPTMRRSPVGWSRVGPASRCRIDDRSTLRRRFSPPRVGPSRRLGHLVETSGLVGVDIAGNRQVVGEDLGGNRRRDRAQPLGKTPRKTDEVVGGTIVAVRYRDYSASRDPNLGQKIRDVLEERPVGGHGENRKTLLDKCVRAVA